MDSGRIQRNHGSLILCKIFNTKQTYPIWRKKNLNNWQYTEANKLANVRRQILRDNRWTDAEISQIAEAAKNMTPGRNVEPVLLMKNLDKDK